MNTPIFLNGAALVFWGIETGWLYPALFMGLILEGSRWVRTRWEFTTKEISRFADLSTIIFIGSFFYFYLTAGSLKGILFAIEWMPVSFFPLLFFATYSTSPDIHITALSMLARSRQKRGVVLEGTVNLCLPYFALCIICAGAANHRTPFYYLGFFFLCAWGLFHHRPRRYPLYIWAGCLFLAGISGYAGQSGLHRLQLFLEEKSMEWLSGSFRNDADPYKNTTSMGDIGVLKPSDRILFRVEQKDFSGPLLLQEAAYNLFLFSKWYAARPVFESLKAEADPSTWQIGRKRSEGKTLRVTAPLRKGMGMLKLPEGVFRIEDLPVVLLAINQYRSIKVEGGPPLVSYRVHYDPAFSDGGPPEENDILLPEEEKPFILQAAESLDIAGKPPAVVVSTLSDFFHRNFTYSLVLDKPEIMESPLADFLLYSRSGHCEYFASAGVFLLRFAGIPARYATGYSVHEYSPMEGRYLVRERDSHAWTLAYIDGRWQTLDFTPPSWMSGSEPGLFDRVTDTLSWIRQRFAEWWWIDRHGGLAEYGIWLLVPLVTALAWRLSRQKRVKRLRKNTEAEKKILPAKGCDSPFYRIENRLLEAGLERKASETTRAWLRRLEEEGSLAGFPEISPSIIQYHYRYRFDPVKLSDAQIRDFEWLVGSHLDQ